MSFGLKVPADGSRVEVKTSFLNSKSRTKASFARQCDINEIVKKARITGMIDHVTKLEGIYGDFSNVPDYKGACEVVNQADVAFNALPSEIRTRFKNDPGEFLMFCSDVKNRPEMEKMGLVVKKPEPSAAGVPAAAAPAPEAVSPKGQ